MNEENQELTGKEAYEARKAEKERGQVKQTKNSSKKIMKIVVWIAILILVVVGLVYLVRLSGPEGEDLSVVYEDLGREHIADGAPHEPYNSNPPTSGPHYTQPAVPGFYDEEVPDERVIHNMEHGEVWISYQSDLDPSIIAQLREFAAPKVIITPRNGNTTDITLAAWTRLDMFDVNGELDIQRIEDFIKRYQNRGPEQVPSSTHYRE